jgi:hypothetical protein
MGKITPHDADQGGVRGDGIFQELQIQRAVTVHRNLGQAITLLLQMMEDFAHRRVFHPGSNDMPLSARQSLQGSADGQIVGFRTAAGEDDFLGPGTQ